MSDVKNEGWIEGLPNEPGCYVGKNINLNKYDNIVIWVHGSSPYLRIGKCYFADNGTETTRSYSQYKWKKILNTKGEPA